MNMPLRFKALIVLLLLSLPAAASKDLAYARQLIGRGEYALAVVTLKKQLDSAPVESRSLLSMVYYLEGNYNEASRYLVAARRKGLDEAQFYALKGRIAFLSDDWNTAWAALRSAVALRGRKGDALYWGAVGLAQGDSERAKLGFEKAARSGADGAAIFLRGLSLLATNAQAALQDFRSAQSSLPSESPLRPQVILWQSKALDRLGKKKEARSTLRFLLRVYPGYGPAQEELNRLGP